MDVRSRVAMCKKHFDAVMKLKNFNLSVPKLIGGVFAFRFAVSREKVILMAQFSHCILLLAR